MSFPRSEEFSRNSENLRLISARIDQLQRIFKFVIRRNHIEEVDFMASDFYLHIGIEAEARLRKILTDPTGFSVDEVTEVLTEKKQFERWVKTVDQAFKSKYSKFTLNSAPSTWSEEEKGKAHDDIIYLLKEELQGVIIHRNKLAHGQPKWQLKSGEELKFRKSSDLIKFGDYYSLWKKRLLLAEIANLVSILTTSRPTLEREFETCMDRILSLASDIESNSDGSRYAEFKNSLNRRRAGK